MRPGPHPDQLSHKYPGSQTYPSRLGNTRRTVVGSMPPIGVENHPKAVSTIYMDKMQILARGHS